MNNLELTIISVYHDYLTKKMIETNYDLLTKLNSSTNWIWLVGDNSRPELKEKIDSAKFRVIENKEALSINRQSCGKYWTSYQHASALNLCLTHVKTRFVVILDNDFFVIRPKWLREGIHYLQKHNLAILGAPYYPRDYRKIRYFPSMDFCTFIDSEKVPLDTLDFTPGFNKTNDDRRTAKSHTNLFNLNIRKRNIGTSHDTGYQIFLRYYNDKVARTECIKPVYKPRSDLRLFGKLGFIANTLYELFLPDRLCYIPKQRDSYSSLDFKGFGIFDARGEGWEEHVLEDKPFGFHARSGRHQKKNYGDDKLLAEIKKALVCVSA
ncbi:hypothetical protein A2W48_00660 [Candidatus Giovannonibacteria bacterium RIFCSPHIGHO2_12_44_12]|uniref:Glycosyltransferase 2-like domain-containing protein n=5 Tax=Candidatus Giovannoniibacteriota TaxID=1752738 RepID=A0A1F5WYI6_9BACT|nr:MAG: hypothetical protein UW74_C0011G0004 [Candidatus Giovannonibacteria bacterium GW2011_GWC2_44_8]OGF73432.1 MAG: hypothetical protein A2W57_00905 [Candidatus Giovannonibacteria bacterium RIFCSPHIGHO2_02_43_16]OGF80381.1 MAG: hypothetical protein A2W48_00660 [Candidatus Giovannonibacteria bacterium RIFCSPHIGHO2_12_44_12]OGF85469.1 MAG: hypothetical protein A2Z63_00710 [Candidatus Giovannonibacteria bacterium RIFCSPLOWO2_02_44_8]OGF95673.1 MAG: hypothetical protein A2Y47_02390 [Candidatus G